MSNDETKSMHWLFVLLYTIGGKYLVGFGTASIGIVISIFCFYEYHLIQKKKKN